MQTFHFFFNVSGSCCRTYAKSWISSLHWKTNVECLNVKGMLVFVGLSISVGKQFQCLSIIWIQTHTHTHTHTLTKCLYVNSAAFAMLASATFIYSRIWFTLPFSQFVSVRNVSFLWCLTIFFLSLSLALSFSILHVDKMFRSLKWGLLGLQRARMPDLIWSVINLD